MTSNCSLSFLKVFCYPSLFSFFNFIYLYFFVLNVLLFADGSITSHSGIEAVAGPLYELEYWAFGKGLAASPGMPQKERGGEV
jgi:hypothetical protein